MRSKKWRWVKSFLLIAGIAAILIVFGARFYHTIQTPLWSSLSKAEAAAVEALELTSVSDVERFVSDQPYTVITATYAEDEEVIVWMWSDGLHMERQADGLTKEQIIELALQENSAKELLRVIPGKIHGEYVWEVFYELETEQDRRKYYDYYRFADGKKIETYRLAVER